MKWRRCLCLLAGALFLSGCRDGKGRSKSAPAAAASDPVLARAGNVEVKQSEFLRRLHSATPVQAFSATAQERLQFLRGLVHQKAVAELARRAGLGGDPEFKDLLQGYEEGQLARMYMDRLSAETVVSTAACRAYYNSHAGEFIGPHGSSKPFDSVVKNIRARIQSQMIYKRLEDEEAGFPITIDEDKVKALPLPSNP